ncbi:MAG: hypothetical protein AB4063_10990 [Crocosphaera sp.]
MTTVASIQEEIEQIRASGDVAPPYTWIGSCSVTKKDKKYTYYRLMKADPNHRIKSGKPKTKMVSYLGTANNEKYLKAVAAIERRNQIEKLLKEVEKLEKGVSATQTKKRKPRQPALTTLVMELIDQVQTLQTEIQELKQQLSTAQK